MEILILTAPIKILIDFVATSTVTRLSIEVALKEMLKYAHKNADTHAYRQ